MLASDGARRHRRGACSEPGRKLWSKFAGRGRKLLFLDIHMPEADRLRASGGASAAAFGGFSQTAYDQHALEAFQVNSIDYLMKPIEPRASGSRPGEGPSDCFAQAGPADVPPDLRTLLAQIGAAIKTDPPFPRFSIGLERIASRTGDKAGTGGPVSRDAFLRQR